MTQKKYLINCKAKLSEKLFAGRVSEGEEESDSE